MSLAPIILFTYNRPDHTRSVLKSIKANSLASQSELFIYCDGPKQNATESELDNISQVREIIREERWCDKVHYIESPVNCGLASSIMKGISEVLENYETAIILEDDLYLSPSTFVFLNAALTRYADDERVMSVSAYMYPVNIKNLPEFFFLRMDSCWGWATWKRAWKKFEPDSAHLLNRILQSNQQRDFNLISQEFYLKMLNDEINKKIDSWAIRWYASIFVNNGLCLYPKISYANNIGMDGSGTHLEHTNFYHNNTLNLESKNFSFPNEIQESQMARKEIKAFFSRLIHPTLLNRLKYYLKNIISSGH